MGALLGGHRTRVRALSSVDGHAGADQHVQTHGEANVSLREAHRCIKIWRALWRVAAALKYCQRDADPSLGVRNVEPKPRQAVWEHGEVVRL
jgi:hypothetical protein